MIGGCFRTAFFLFLQKKVMKLIIDCGSTKADWLIINGDKEVCYNVTPGFNPNYTDKNTISSITLNNKIYIPYIEDIKEVIFYGSGCSSNKNSSLIKQILEKVFTRSEIKIYCDMMAACHALFGDKKGIAGILGTGSNSCLYENGIIKDRAISLGYILGDEGSGAYIGKHMLRDYFYGSMPQELREKFHDEYKIQKDNVITNIYSGRDVSRFIASFLPFAYNNIHEEYFKGLCYNSFNTYITNFIIRYEIDETYDIGLVGSVAYYFKDIIDHCFTERNIKLSSVIKSPIEGLKQYHCHH